MVERMAAYPVQAGCTGKKQFDKFSQADKAAKRRNRSDNAHLEAYHCRHCGSFHVGEARSYGQRRPRAVDFE